MKTTLRKLQEKGACGSNRKPYTDRFKVLLDGLGKSEPDDRPLSLKKILEINGIDDALWALRAVEGHDREIRLIACDFAESVLPIFEEEYPEDLRPRKAIEVSRRYAEGQASKEELAAARDARDAAWAARAAARAAAWAARAAARDARDAAWDAEKEKQRKILLKYI